MLFCLNAVDLTDKLLYHCSWCLRNFSSAACRLLENGTMSCVRCKERLLDDLLCNECDKSSWGSNVTESCNACLCNGSFDASQLNDCNNVDDGKYFVCQSNSTSLQCKHCMNSNGGGTSFQGKCAKENDKVETKKKSGTRFFFFFFKCYTQVQWNCALGHLL